MNISVIHANDAKIRDAVEAELAWSPEVADAAGIGVGVHDGIVTLNGTVSSYHQKLAAGTAALSTSGVTAVANEITVVYGARHDDADIAERARDALRLNAQIPINAVHVHVSNGVVTLSGNVNWDYQRWAARRVAGAVEGVTSVIDTIDLAARVSSSATKDEIRSAFSRLANVDADHIDVEVLDTSVTLTGVVSSYAEKLAASHAAWASPHVTHVQNDLLVR